VIVWGTNIYFFLHLLFGLLTIQINNKLLIKSALEIEIRIDRFETHVLIMSCYETCFNLDRSFQLKTRSKPKPNKKMFILCL